MSLIFVFIFFDVDPVKTFSLALGTYEVTQQLGALVLANVNFISKTGWVAGIADKLTEHPGPLGSYGTHMVRRLLESGLSAEDAVWSQIMPTAGAMVANQAQVTTQILDFYLTEEAGKPYWPEIVKAAHETGPESDERILRYLMEAIRIHGTFGSYRRASTACTIDDEGFSGASKEIKAGDKVFVSFVSAPFPCHVRPLHTYQINTDIAVNNNRSKPTATPKSSPTHLQSASTVQWKTISTTASVRTPVSAEKPARSVSLQSFEQWRACRI